MVALQSAPARPGRNEYHTTIHSLILQPVGYPIMIWKKAVYDDLISCSVLCDAFATECSGTANIDDWYRSIFLSLDCADSCRQLAVFYVREAEGTGLMAKACMEVCTKCAQEMSQFDSAACKQVYAGCQQAILSCVTLLQMTERPEFAKNQAASTLVFYGIDLHETLYK